MIEGGGDGRGGWGLVGSREGCYMMVMGMSRSCQTG